MELETQPQPGRPTISANEAGRRLRRDRRTIQKMIASGDLEGGERPGKQRRWYVYEDQLTSATTPRSSPPYEQPGDTDLQQEIDRLRAELVSANETTRLLRAANAEILHAAESQRAVTKRLIDVNEEFRQAIIESEHSRDHLWKVISFYGTALGQYTTPGTLAEFEPHPSI